MKKGYSLRPPRFPGGAWYFRCTYMGTRMEISTKLSEQAAAEAFAADLYRSILDDPIINLEDPRPSSMVERQPESISLGMFERFLTTSFTLVGEQIVRLGTGRHVSFYVNKSGYRQTDVFWDRRRRRVLEHRWKFLLHHRWLPRSIDHINRVRDDNRIANLRASTPFLQAGNRGHAPL